MRAIRAAAAVMLVACRPALAYDDPAVAVCEYVYLKGKPSGYVRVAERIAGDTVELTYERSVLNTKPIRSTATCRFEAAMDGALSLAREKSTAVEACISVADHLEEAKKTLNKLTYDQRAQLDLKARNCRPILEAYLQAEQAWVLDVGFPLISSGIYPIKPADTQLKVEIDRARYEKACAETRQRIKDAGAKPEVTDQADAIICEKAGF